MRSREVSMQAQEAIVGLKKNKQTKTHITVMAETIGVAKIKSLVHCVTVQILMDLIGLYSYFSCVLAIAHVFSQVFQVTIVSLVMKKANPQRSGIIKRRRAESKPSLPVISVDRS